MLFKFVLILAVLAAPVFDLSDRSTGRFRGNTHNEAYDNQMSKERRITRAEIIMILQEGKDLGVLNPDLGSDPATLEQIAQSILDQIVYLHHEGEPTVAGQQQFVLSTPKGDKVEPLPIFLEGPEWTAIFEKALEGTFVERYKDETAEQWRERQKVHFSKLMPEYPLLARIWSIYADVTYESSEIAALKNECLMLNSNADPIARKGLEKLSQACEFALEKQLNLLLLAE